jgi:putative transposase
MQLQNPMTWSQDGKCLFVVTSVATGPHRILRVTVETGDVVDSGITVAGGIKRMSYGSEGLLAISVSRGASELWIEPLQAFRQQVQ